jgi:hypothetical protein
VQNTLAYFAGASSAATKSFVKSPPAEVGRRKRRPGIGVEQERREKRRAVTAAS